MNATIGVCHFCETHGPRPVFCTFATDNEDSTTESSTPTAHCNGCRSLGPETVIVTKDENDIFYCSRESIPDTEINSFLRQAAIRSITCEVSWSQEGGIVFFSDTKGHVLSCTFQVKDTRARGLKRWFSIVVLMKDKAELLQISPVLSEHMQDIAKELQELADKVFDEEQKVCPQRALRLNIGSNYFGQSRSLVQLTGTEDVFKRLHTYFTNMLQAVAYTYSEEMFTSQDLFKKLNIEEKGVFTSSVCDVPQIEDSVPLRELETLLGKDLFRILLFSVLTGVNVVIRPAPTGSKSNTIVRSLSRVVPVSSPDCVPHVHVTDDDDVTESTDLCLVTEEDGCFTCKWLGTLPKRCPTLMSRIEEAMNCDTFTDDVLHQHVNYLQLHWLSIASTFQAAIKASGAKSDAVVKLKPVLGIAPHDEALVQYWIDTFL